MAFKILIVDDSAADRLIIEKMLNDFDTIVAADGIEAFQKLDEYPDIRLIILDLNMPAMDGYEVLTKLKSNHNLIQCTPSFSPIMMKCKMKSRFTNGSY
jgi:CheY-like chemotaxis protein